MNNTLALIREKNLWRCLKRYYLLMEKESYITGFVDGEGSFNISFTLRKKMKFGIEISFSVSQNMRDCKLLEEIRNFFGCGSVRFTRRDNCYKYETRSITDLTKKIIPHFERYPLRTSKQHSFVIFKEVCEMIKKNLHLTKEGIIKIIDLAYQMNNLGARRYKKEYLLRILDKMKI